MAISPTPVLLDPDRVDELSGGAVLSAAREMKRVEHAAAAAQLVLACAWADQHPALEPGTEAVFVERGADGGTLLPIAGPGCPGVAEFSIAEFGAVLGESTTSAKRLIGQALELRHRLPRLWTLAQSGRVPAWRARLVAAETISAGVSMEAAAWVDSQVAAVAGKITTSQTRRLVAAAVVRHRLDIDTETDAASSAGSDGRFVTCEDNLDASGTATVTAVVTTADALDLDHALQHGAATLKALGSTAPLDVRRSQALGDLARHQTALDLHDPRRHEQESPLDATPLPAAREIVLTLHFDATLAGDHLTVGPLGRLDRGQRLVLLDHVKAWCTDAHTRVSIRPVIDLTQRLAAPGYAIPARIRDHIVHRDRHCMFPHCTRPATACDLDHVSPYDHEASANGRAQPGPTATDNLIALCRHHHRLKTHTGWRVEMNEPGAATWTSPHGHRYRVDHTGTEPLAPRPPEPRD